MVKYLYFLGDEYGSDTAAPNVSAYQWTVGGGSTRVNRDTPFDMIRLQTTPGMFNETSAYILLKESDGFWLLAPDASNSRKLSTFNLPTCKDQQNPFFPAYRTFLAGVELANAGVYTYTAGPDRECNTGDDQYWRIRLSMSAGDDPESISREIAYSQPLLATDRRLLGYLYAEPDQSIKVFDPQGNLIQDLSQGGTPAIANGYAVLSQTLNPSSTVLVVGQSLYLVNTEEVVAPDFTLPAPLVTFSASEPVSNIRLDEDRLYVIDGNTLTTIDYETRSATPLYNSASGISFGNTQKPHHKVFTTHHLVILESSAGQNQLVAINKATGNRTTLADGRNVADEYLASGHYIYFSELGTGEARAVVYSDSGDGAAPALHRPPFEHARWYFYQNHRQQGSRFEALLMQADSEQEPPLIDADGFFRNPVFSIYLPENPDQALDEKSKASGFIRVREIGTAESGHLLLALETSASGTSVLQKDPLDLYYITPKKRITKVSVKADNSKIICERLDETADPLQATAPLCSPELVAEGN